MAGAHRVESHEPRKEPRPTRSAASGIAVSHSNSQTYLALANFYGERTLYQLDMSRPGLAPKQVQSFVMAAAHDWEAITLPGGITHLVASEYDADR